MPKQVLQSSQLEYGPAMGMEGEVLDHHQESRLEHGLQMLQNGVHLFNLAKAALLKVVHAIGQIAGTGGFTETPAGMVRTGIEAEEVRYGLHLNLSAGVTRCLG